MEEYVKHPVALFESIFYEINKDHIVKVNMNNFEVQKMNITPFPEDLKNPSFLQLGATLLIQNLKNLYFLNLGNLEWKAIEDFTEESLEGAMIVVKEATKIQFFANSKVVEYDTQTFKS